MKNFFALFLSLAFCGAAFSQGATKVPANSTNTYSVENLTVDPCGTSPSAQYVTITGALGIISRLSPHAGCRGYELQGSSNAAGATIEFSSSPLPAISAGSQCLTRLSYQASAAGAFTGSSFSARVVNGVSGANISGLYVLSDLAANASKDLYIPFTCPAAGVRPELKITKTSTTVGAPATHFTALVKAMGPAISDSPSSISPSGGGNLPTQAGLVKYTTSGNTGYTSVLPDATLLANQVISLVYVQKSVGPAATESVVVDGFGSQTISGASEVYLTQVGDTYVLYSDGSNWIVIARNIQAVQSVITATGSVTNNAGYASARTSGSAITITLPSALLAANKFLTVAYDAQTVLTDTVTVLPFGGQLIGSRSSLTLTRLYDSALLYSDGSSWLIMSKVESSLLGSASVSKNVSDAVTGSYYALSGNSVALPQGTHEVCAYPIMSQTGATTLVYAAGTGFYGANGADSVSVPTALTGLIASDATYPLVGAQDSLPTHCIRIVVGNAGQTVFFVPQLSYAVAGTAAIRTQIWSRRLN